MKALILAAALLLPGTAGATCTSGGSPLNLSIPILGSSGNNWAACIRNSLLKLSTAAANVDSATSTAYNFGTIAVNKITGRAAGAAYIQVSSSVYMTDESTLTIQGNAFSVGATTFSVLAGTTSIAKLQLTGIGANVPLIMNSAGQAAGAPLMGNGGLLIGTGGTPSTGTLSGTANQISVTNAAGTITLSAPQNIDTNASPTFDNSTLEYGIQASTGRFTGASSTFTIISSSAIRVDAGGITIVSGNFDYQTATEELVPLGNSGTSFAIYWSSGSVSSMTLTGNVTFTFHNAQPGQSHTLILKQDATGSRTVTWPTVVWPAATAPTLTTTAGKRDIITFFYSGNEYFGFTGGLNY